MESASLPTITVGFAPLNPPCHKFVNSQFISQFPAYFPYQTLHTYLSEMASMLNGMDNGIWGMLCCFRDPSPAE
jgi:hypothetical protein